MIKSSVTFDEEKLEEFIYKVSIAVRAGWERYEHTQQERGWSDYRYEETVMRWRHPTKGDAQDLDGVYWTELGEPERLNEIDRMWDEYLTAKAKSGKKNAL